MPTNQNSMADRDRRARLRFPVNMELRYHLAGNVRGEPLRGIGQALNISSKGLAFRADRPLDRGMCLSISMAWPAKLDNQCSLRLIVEGTVLRAEGDLIVLGIERSEFRTAGTSTGAARDEIAAMTRFLGTPYAPKVVAPGAPAEVPVR